MPARHKMSGFKLIWARFEWPECFREAGGTNKVVRINWMLEKRNVSLVTVIMRFVLSAVQARSLTALCNY